MSLFQKRCVFDSIIHEIPSPTNKFENETSRALIFDSFYDQFRGVVAYIRVFGGSFKKSDQIKLISNDINFFVLYGSKIYNIYVCGPMRIHSRSIYHICIKMRRPCPGPMLS